MNIEKSFTLVLLVILLTITLMPLKAYSMDNENPITNSFSDLKMDERKLWIDYIDAYDKGEYHMIKFADIISDGIFKQFPKKFS